MTENVAGEKAQRFVVLDGMRGVAAVMVAITHGFLIFPFAGLAVDLFFILSGFVLAHGYGHRIGTLHDRLDFMIARFIRLEPLWLVGCALAIPAGIGMAWFGWADWAWKMLAISIVTAPFFIILPYFGISIPLNYPGWSLSFELIANATMLVVGAALRPAILLMLLSAPFLAYSVVIWDGGENGWQAIWAGFPRVLFSFFLGVALFQFGRRGWLPKIAVHPVLILAAVALICGMQTEWSRSYVLLCLFLANPLIVTFGIVSVANGRLRRLCTWMGDISYGVYVLHSPLIMSAEGILFLMVEGDASNYKQTGAVGWIVVPLAILLSHILTYRFDMPLRRRLVKRLLPDATGR